MICIRFNWFIFAIIMEQNNKKKLQVWTPLLLSLAMIAGMFFGYRMRDNMPGKGFFERSKSNPVQELLQLISNKYVDSVNINQLSDTAIAAILSKLDPHSIYIPAEELQDVNEDIAGQFFGIGIEFNILKDTVNVLQVLPDGPSAKAGLQIGDKIIKVGDSTITGKKINSDQVRKLLRGELGSTVTVTLRRDNTIKTAVITRDIIPLTSVDASYVIAPQTGYIKLNKFSQSTYREFMQSLEKLQTQGIKKLILDLRGNGGGVLDEATSIADEFLDGDKLITYTEGKNFPKKEYRCKRLGLFEKGELVVMADEGTASASEVLIGALQDWDRATIVGRRSFGKGLVQEQYDLSNGSALRLTVARYYTPIGRSIQRSYENGGDAYYDDINKRFHDGEVMSKDSIKNDTSKMFKTMKGKTVYGGGGITPDIFVAFDTSYYTPEVSKLYYRGTLNTFAYEYYLQNKSTLSSYKSPIDFANNFTFSDDNWKTLIYLAGKDTVSIGTINVKEKMEVIKRAKATLARQIWRTEGYFEVSNVTDDAIAAALKALSSK